LQGAQIRAGAEPLAPSLEPLQIDVIYTDFAKAFDKVPHCRLISKLHSYGVMTNWFYGLKNTA